MRLVAEATLWVACRLAALSTLALPLGYYVPSDLSVFDEWATSLAAGTPITGDLWQYPAGVALLLGIIGVSGGGTPALLGVILAADLAVLILLRRSAGALLWAISPLFVGPIMLTRLETLVALTAVAGLLARSSHGAGLWWGVGASLKLWPAALVTAIPGRALARAAWAAAAFAVVTSAAALAFEAPPFLGNQGRRGLQVESVAAWPFMLARALGAPVRLVSRNGSMEVAGPLADTIAILLLPVAAGAIGAFLVWSWRRLKPADAHSVAAHSLVVVLLFLTTSRVLSPQFIVWAIGICALMMAAGHVRGALVACLLGSAFFAQVLYPHAYVDYLSEGGIGLAVQTTRLALLLAALVLAWREVVRLAASRSESLAHSAPITPNASGHEPR